MKRSNSEGEEEASDAREDREKEGKEKLEEEKSDEEDEEERAGVNEFEDERGRYVFDSSGNCSSSLSSGISGRGGGDNEIRLIKEFRLRKFKS